MKIQITMTKEEHDNTIDIVMLDPCTHIQCGQIDCEVCPFRESAEGLRKAKEKFMRVLNEIEVKNDN
jgi:hypothetical protein